MHPTAAKVKARLAAAGLDIEVHELAESTRTAAEAAAAAGCEPGQIVKSLVFVDADGVPLLVLCAGDRRVDPARLGRPVRQARAREVRDLTGFAIGGVPPLGHDRPLETVVDVSLRRYDVVWSAAGTPYAIFPVDTERLIAALPDARVEDVGEAP